MPLASNALTTLEAIKSERGISGDTQDSLLERRINGYSALVESLTGRKFKKTTYTEKYAGHGGVMLVLQNYPIIDVRSVCINGSETEYEIDDRLKESGQILREAGWPSSGTLIGLVGEPYPIKRNITVEYTAGYVLPKDETEEFPRTLPYDLEKLVIGLISEDLNKMGSEGMKSIDISDFKWEWMTQQSSQTTDILSKYRRFVV